MARGHLKIGIKEKRIDCASNEELTLLWKKRLRNKKQKGLEEFEK
jgi:hypothetical protein